MRLRHLSISQRMGKISLRVKAYLKEHLVVKISTQERQYMILKWDLNQKWCQGLLNASTMRLKSKMLSRKPKLARAKLKSKSLLSQLVMRNLCLMKTSSTGIESTAFLVKWSISSMQNSHLWWRSRSRSYRKKSIRYKKIYSTLPRRRLKVLRPKCTSYKTTSKESRLNTRSLLLVY